MTAGRPTADQSTVEKLFDLESPLFSRDFIMVDLLPSVALVAGTAGLLMAGAPDSAPNGHALAQGLEHTTNTSLGFLLAISVALAVLVRPLALPMRRVLSGSWTSPVLKRLAERGRQRAHARLKVANKRIDVRETPNAAERARWNEIYSRELPDPAFLAPTRLGNAYEALRDRLPPAGAIEVLNELSDATVYRAAYQRANADNPKLATAIDDSRLKIAAAERYVFVWFVFAIIAALLLYRSGWWLLLAPLSALVSLVAYRGTVHAVVQHSYLIELLFPPPAPLAGDRARREPEPSSRTEATEESTDS